MGAEQEAAFLEDVNPNLGIVHSVCRAYVPRHTPEYDDVYQDIMYQLWKSYPQFKGDSKFSTWMYRVALNTAIAHVRRSVRAPRDAELTAAIADSTRAHDDAQSTEDIERLYRAIETLSDVDKAIVLLHLDDHGYDDIASITGLTKTNVSVRLVRIRRALADRLQQTA
ncbi:MAG: RNA polymerase sigma factor [Steroidobacteraceae bacterium]